MDALIQSLTSYLNLSKLTAVTVPGMIVAFALVLVLGPIPCRDDSNSCPYCSAALKPTGSTGKSLEGKGKTAAPAGPPAAPASKSSNAGTPSKKSAQGADQKAANTVVTSEATWADNAAGVAVSRTQLSKELTGLVGKALKPGDEIYPLINDLPGKCGKLPLYVVPNSRPTSEKSGNSTSDGGKESKVGSPKYAGEIARPVEDILDIADNCYAALTQLDGALQVRMASSQSDITQDTTNINTISASLVAAQASGNELVVRDLRKKLDDHENDLKQNQETAKALAQADAYVATLISQVNATRTAVSSQVTAAPPVPANSSTAADVFQTIQQNFLKFLIFSLILGQILDPIQRGLLSFVGPRRDEFVRLNRVYGQKGDGELRYGDRRLPPWTDEDFLPPLPPENADQARTEKEEGDREGLRYGVADFVYRRNMNIYDPNYAIGAGYITQSEFNGIYTEFYSQSQITSGLILPLFVLSVCIGIRIICCSASLVGWDCWLLIGAVCGAIYIGIVMGWLASLLISHIGSRAYGQPRSPWPASFRRSVGKSLASKVAGRRSWVTVVVMGALAFSSVFVWANTNVLKPEVLPMIGLPCLFVIPLWRTGLDRLHKFYSELQARIAGNILRLQESTEQKMVDMIDQSESLTSLKTKLRESGKNRDKLLGFIDEQLKGKEPPPSPPSPAAAQPGPGSPGSGPGQAPPESASPAPGPQEPPTPKAPGSSNN